MGHASCTARADYHNSAACRVGLRVRDSSLKGLKTFCVAARRLSFKAAADELCVTPSAVSHQIKALERQISAELFERRTREVVLTDVGATFFAQVEPLLTELDNVVRRFRQRGLQRRVLRLALMPFFASELFIPRLGEFARRHRSIDIRVDTTEAGAAHSPSCDASILLLPAPPGGLASHPLFSLRLGPACSPQIARELDGSDARALLAQTLIVHKSRPHAWSEWFAVSGLALDREPKVIRLDSMFAVARAAERGLGIALVPTRLAAAWYASGALTRLSGVELETPDRYYFVHRVEDAGDRDVCALRDWVLAEFAENENMSAVA